MYDRKKNYVMLIILALCYFVLFTVSVCRGSVRSYANNVVTKAAVTYHYHAVFHIDQLKNAQLLRTMSEINVVRDSPSGISFAPEKKKTNYCQRKNRKPSFILLVTPTLAHSHIQGRIKGVV